MLRRNGITGLDIVILVAIVLVGLIKLPHPFMGDQALNTVIAKKMSQGEVLYRDMWDIKQPGVFIFLLIAGKIFSFDEVGVHAFELIYMVLFSIILIFSLKDYFDNRAMVSLAPLFTVGIYYGIADVWHQTQSEALVGFPIFLTLWFALTALRLGDERARRWWFASGFMGGIVVLFKLMFLPIIAVFWLTALWKLKNRIQYALFSCIAPIFLGLLLPILTMLFYLVQHNVLDLALWTIFIYPVLVMRETPPNTGILRDGLRWFINNFAPLMALGSIGAYVSLNRRKDLLALNLVLWCVVGLGVILSQRISWWQYHYLLLFVPLGILSVRGLDVILSFVKKQSHPTVMWKSGMVMALSLSLLFSPIISNLALRGISLARNGFALSEEKRLEYQMGINSAYRLISQEVAFLSQPGSIPGEIYVFGDPLYYHLSGRDPAIPLYATWFRAIPEQWTRILDLLDEKRPAYVFVSVRAFDEVQMETTPRIAPYLEQTIPRIEKNYRLLHSSEFGAWYVLSQ